MRWFLGALVFFALVSAVLFACGTDAVGVEACKAIERTRCKWAVACGVNLYDAQPVRRSNSTSPVDDCFRYYDDACLHGLPVPDPGDAAVSACIAAINDNQGDCTIVLHPETADACAWLIPIPDAGSEAEAGDADAGD